MADYYTLKGYEIHESKEITYAMEDYLEMICRISKNNQSVRVSVIASKLNVRPSSASKMISNLKKHGLVNFEKYGYILPTKEGLSIGEYLIFRHEVLCTFLQRINKTDDVTEEVEKIEHFLAKKTIENINTLNKRLKFYV